MNGIITFILSFTSGYVLSHYVSHPVKKNERLPRIKYKNIELLPNLKIHIRNNTIWVHHWILFGVMTLTSFFIADGILTYLFVKGVFMGCTIQGLRYKDRFCLRNPRYKS